MKWFCFVVVLISFMGASLVLACPVTRGQMENS